MTRSFSLLAATAFVAAAAATPAVAGSCCGCAYTCAPPALVAPTKVQIWGLSPQFVVNQGPVFSGPGYYTAPTFEGESLTVDYPYVGYGGYDPFRHRLHHNYWEGALPGPQHFAVLSRHEAGVVYRRGFGPRVIAMPAGERLVARGHRDLGEPRLR